MGKTNIESLDYGWNFFPGCLHQETGLCPIKNCWAKSALERQGRTTDPQYLREKILEPLPWRKAGFVAVNWMGDLGGSWADPGMSSGFTTYPGGPPMSLRDKVFDVILQKHLLNFLFLTKNSRAWVKWSPFPRNAWPGATACDTGMAQDALGYLWATKARVKFIYFEPLMEEIKIKDLGKHFLKSGIKWIIIGAQSRPRVLPEYEWVSDLVQAADQAGAKIWIKNSLNTCAISDYPVLLDAQGNLRQEMPV